MRYDTCGHLFFRRRYHIFRSMAHRHTVLAGDFRLRMRDVRFQACRGNGVDIPRGVIPGDHVHMSVPMPRSWRPALMRGMNGRPFLRARRQFPHIRKRYRGDRFRARGYLSTTS